jgi:hypothetical protein
MLPLSSVRTAFQRIFLMSRRIKKRDDSDTTFIRSVTDADIAGGK